MEWLGHHLGDHVRRGQIPLGTARLDAIVDGVEVGADVIRIVGAEGSRETALAGTSRAGFLETTSGGSSPRSSAHSATVA